MSKTPEYLAFPRRYWAQINVKIHPKIEELLRKRADLFHTTMQQVVNEALNDHLMAGVNIEEEFKNK